MAQSLRTRRTPAENPNSDLSTQFRWFITGYLQQIPHHLLASATPQKHTNTYRYTDTQRRVCKCKRIIKLVLKEFLCVP